MKTQVNEHEFINTFDRIDRSENFTVAARRALFEYYESLEEDCEMEIDFDPIAICCDWSEYENACRWAMDYYTKDRLDDILPGLDSTQDAIESHFMSYLRENTEVIEFDGGILVEAF